MNNVFRIFASACLLGSLMSMPLVSHAADGVVVDDISLQTGPDSDYPPITQLATGTQVSIQGCIDDYSWCDVIVGDDRGWIPGTYLEDNYDNQEVIVTDYGPRIGIPVVAFSFGVYWDQHYRNRRWYSDRSRWESHRIAHRPPPRPAHVLQARTAPAVNPRNPTPTREPARDGRGHAAPVAQSTTPNPRADARPAPRSAENKVAPTPHNPAAQARAEAAASRAEVAHNAAPAAHAVQKPAPKVEPKVDPKAPQRKEEGEHKDGDHKNDGKDKN